PEGFDVLHFNDDQIFIDGNYRKRVNVHGGTYIPGEVWLVKQAIDAFKFFTKSDIDDSVYNLLFEKISTLDRFNVKKKIIYLVGMPGSGKSTVGEVFASALGFDLVDIDKLIEKRVGMSINDIFSKYSEAYFRKVESEILSEVSKFERVIVSTGGGVVLREENRGILKQGHVVWLWSDIRECAKRVFRKNNRPLLSSDGLEELTKKMGNLLSNRLEYYISVADLVLPVDRLNVSQVAERLQRELGSYV
ncbi:MAG: shikimate kinase, partial [Fervidobacterium pennivorans]